MGRYSNTLKKTVVESILNQNKDIKQVCAEKGLKLETVKQWIKKYSQDKNAFEEKVFPSIKEELQGNGLIRQIRSLFLGNTKEMAGLALKTFENNIKHKLSKEEILENTDDILKCLIVEETKIFYARNQQLAENIIPIYYDEFYEKDNINHHMKALVQRLVAIYTQVQENEMGVSEFIKEMNHQMMPVSQHIITSNSQSAKVRAGASLENHIAKLMELCDFPFDSQQQIVEGETIADFFLPSLSAIQIDPNFVMNIECQTTLKDRHRLTSGKLTNEPIKRYLATGTGCGLFNKGDVRDFTINKLKELILVNNITIVVFDDVKTQLVNKIESVYEHALRNGENASELEQLKKRSSQAIISYKELFNSRIVNLDRLWEANNMK